MFSRPHKFDPVCLFFWFFLDPVARWLPGLNSQYIHCMGLDPIHSELLRYFSLIFRVRSHWVTNIAINCTTKFATKFVTKNEMGLIPIFATKYLRLSNLQMSMPSYSFNCVSNPFNFPHQCSTKLFTVMKWVWYLIEWGTDADAKVLSQCEWTLSVVYVNTNHNGNHWYPFASNVGILNLILKKEKKP